MSVSASEFFQKLRYRLFHAPKGMGKPISKKEANECYRTGEWDFLDSVDELANYMVVGGYVQFLAKSLNDPPTVLDLGSGPGNVAELLGAYPLDRYLELDISNEAICEARNRNLKNSEFRVGTFEETETEEQFDFIISTGAIHMLPILSSARKTLTKSATGWEIYYFFMEIRI